jgi:hypothetical protein
MSEFFNSNEICSTCLAFSSGLRKLLEADKSTACCPLGWRRVRPKAKSPQSFPGSISLKNFDATQNTTSE